MSGNEIKTQVFIPNQERKTRGVAQYPPGRLMTLDVICEWIRLQALDDYTTNGLIELAGKYPTQALPSFRRNFNLMIARVRENRKKEQNQPSEIEEWSTEISVEDLVIAEEEVENDQS